MFSAVDVRGYRCLYDIRQALDRFHVLIGPNASGKSTFIDVIRFLGDLVGPGLGLEYAVERRSPNLADLSWNNENRPFELAVETVITPEQQAIVGEKYSTCRYEVRIGVSPDTGENAVLDERVLLLPASRCRPVQRLLFPESGPTRDTIMSRLRKKGTKTIIRRSPGGNDNYYSEVDKSWSWAFKLGPNKSALGNLPGDEEKFPVSTALKRTLESVQHLVLNSELMRQASPPGQLRRFLPDGSNLPWVVYDLAKKAPDRLSRWVEHLKTALPDLVGIHTVEREDDRHRYLMLEYDSGLRVPSWLVSDGTLRLLALTLLAYAVNPAGTMLIEEPENGIHPRAVETLFQSLSSVYDAQVIVASHSPVILSIANYEDILCFGRTSAGATDIVRGSDHPELRNWQGEPNLSVLFAAGVLS